MIIEFKSHLSITCFRCVQSCRFFAPFCFHSTNHSSKWKWKKWTCKYFSRTWQLVHELLKKSCKYVKQENYEGIFVEVNKVVSTLIFLFCVHFMRFEPASKLPIWGVARSHARSHASPLAYALGLLAQAGLAVHALIWEPALRQRFQGNELRLNVKWAAY